MTTPYVQHWWYFGAPWTWPYVKITRGPSGWWRYHYRGRKSAGQGAYPLLRDALRVAVGHALGRRWGWRPGWMPNFDNVPMEHDDWTITVECGHTITRTYMHSTDLDRLPVDRDDEPVAYCPEHGFERLWFTAGVLDPDGWYVGEPGTRSFGERLPVPTARSTSTAETPSA